MMSTGQHAARGILAPADPPVVIERRGTCLWVVFNSPAALNPLSPAVLDGLDAAIDRAASDDGVRALVLTGTGRAFSAGVDLKFVDSATDEAVIAFLARLQESLRRLEVCSLPVIAAVNGLAMAGGLEIALCCDFVIAAASAKFGDGHSSVGLVPSAGASFRLPRRVGVLRAKEMILTGRLYDANQMLAAGLVNNVVPDDLLVSATTGLVVELAAKSPLSMSRSKALINEGVLRSPEEGIEAELSMAALHQRSFDAKEGLRAFINKREPRFQGR